MKSIFAVIVLAAAFVLEGAIPLKNNDRVAFLGDSITGGGADKRHGFITLVAEALRREGIKIVPLACGVSGDTAPKMLDRLEDSTLCDKPQWVFVSAGVNDSAGVSLKQYREALADISADSRKSGAKMVYLTPTRPREKPDALNAKIRGYVNAMRKQAEKENAPLIDIHSMSEKAVAEQKAIYSDGIHMNAEGNILFAIEILRGIGVSEEKIGQYAEEWRKNPDADREYVWEESPSF